MNLQNINAIEKQVKSYLKRNNNPSVVTLFKKFRTNPKIQFNGDFELICYLITLANKQCKTAYNRTQLLRAINLDPDIKSLPKKEKFEVLNYLVSFSKTCNR